MTSAVLDASVVLAPMRHKPGNDKVALHVGPRAITEVNLQEIVKERPVSGLDEPVIRDLLSKLRLDVLAHDIDAA